MSEPLATLSVREFVERLASKTPVPGGGSVSALALAHAAAVAGMVVEYSLGKRALEAHQTALEEARRSLAGLRERGLALMRLDAERYAVLNDAMRLPKDDPDRAERLREAALGATEPPLEVIDAARQTLEVVVALVAKTSPILRSDLGVAGALALAAADGGAWSVQANLPMLGADRPACERRCGSLLARAREARARLESAMEAANAREGAARAAASAPGAPGPPSVRPAPGSSA